MPGEPSEVFPNTWFPQHFKQPLLIKTLKDNPQGHIQGTSRSVYQLVTHMYQSTKGPIISCYTNKNQAGASTVKPQLSLLVFRFTNSNYFRFQFVEQFSSHSMSQPILILPSTIHKT